MTRKPNDTRGGRKPPPTPAQDADRIAKVMARAGLCSRRDAEEWIAAGRVAVNGGTISSPAVNVTARDRVTVDGKPLPRRERTRLFLYYKPVGLVSTNSDPQGRPTVFDAIPKNLPRLLSVGRLDIGTEGLLLLTNDGGLARVLELPQTAWVRRYRVRAHGRVTQGELDKLRDGITIEGIHYGPIEATLEREQGANVWLAFAIREGKNREVRNVLTELGLQVNRLIRVEFGPFGLGELAEGAIEEVETRNLQAQLGDHIIAQAGCDFAGPVAERPAAPVAGRELRREVRHALRDRSREERPDRPRDQRREERGPARDNDDRRPPRRSRPDADARPEKPPGRPRRGDAWRKEDAPLRRTYRGSRRDELKIADEARPDKRAGLVKDKKGRRILVERFGTKKEKPEPEAARGRPPRGPKSRDRASGPRPSRPRFSEERAAADTAEPRKFGSRPDGGRTDGPRKFGSRSDGPRTDRPRPDGPRKFEPRKFGPRSEGPDKRRGDFAPRIFEPGTSGPRKDESGRFGPRPPRPSGPPRPRPSGPRPSGSRPPGSRPTGSRPSGPRPPRAR